MQGIAISILKTIIVNIMTYKLVATLIVELLEFAADHTENKVDDNLVKAVREALLVKPVSQGSPEPGSQ